MMLLDVGNTTVRWAFTDGHGLTGQGSFVHRGHAVSTLADQAWAGREAPDAMAVANVAGRPMQDTITRWTREHWNLVPLFIQVAAGAAGVTNAYAMPQQLGVDRWAAMVAAWHDHQSAVLVIDCGSAITADVVDAGGRHHGGLIAPGVGMMRDSLSQNTANIDILPPDEARTVTLLSDGTQAAIRNGTIYMASAMIDRVAAEVTDRFGSGIRAVMTGGDAPLIQPMLGCETIHDPDLVLKGVAILSEEQA
jgi:type III pantothenate kinase